MGRNIKELGRKVESEWIGTEAIMGRNYDETKQELRRNLKVGLTSELI